MKDPIFVSGIEFKGPGSRFTLGLRKGKKVYEFSTNYKEIYPKKIYARSFEEGDENRQNLEELIAYNTDSEFSVEMFNENVLELRMEKADFENLPKQIQEMFQRKYKPKAMWNIGVHRKVDLTQDLESILEKNYFVNKELSNIRWKLRDFYFNKKKQEYDFYEEQVNNLLEPIFEDQLNDELKLNYLKVQKLLETIINDNRLKQEIAEHLREKFYKIMYNLNDLELNFVNRENLRYTIANLMTKAVHFKYEKKINTQLKGLLKRKYNYLFNKSIQRKANKIRKNVLELETIIKEKDEKNEYYLDDNLRLILYLDIMSRDSKRNIILDGLNFRKIIVDEEEIPERLSYEEFQKLPKAVFDIEKFLFGSRFEIISHCGLRLVEYKDGEEKVKRYVDTVRKCVRNIIDGYGIRTEKWEHEAIINTARTLNDAEIFADYVFNGNYDFFHYKQSLNFLLGLSEKPPIKEATVEKDEEGKDFMGRYGVRNQEVIDIYKLSEGYMPHLLQHRLETIVKYLFKKSKISREWGKTQDYETGREQDIIWPYFDSEDTKKRKKARNYSYNNMFYTKDDVEGFAEAINSSYGTLMMKDLFELRDTFNLSLTSITSSPNSVRNYLEQRFYEMNRRLLDLVSITKLEPIKKGKKRNLRKERRDLINSFKDNYSVLKVKTFKKLGLEMYSEHKPSDKVYQYYFSPEMNIALKINPLFFKINDFINETHKIADHERQIGRLEFVKSFFTPMMAEYTHIRRKKERFVGELNKNKYIVRGAEHPLNELFNELKNDVGIDKEIPILKFNKEATKFFNGLYGDKIDPLGSKTKGLLDELRTYRKLSLFFEQCWGTRPSELELCIDEAFQSATDVMNNSNAMPLTIKDNLIFCKNKILKDEAAKAGLLEIRRLPIYRFGKDMEDVVYHSEERYSNVPNREIATNHLTYFEIKLVNKLNDKIFERDYRAALETIADSARELNKLESKIRYRDSIENINFFESLLYHIRKRNIYKTYFIKDDELKPFELSEEVKHRFNPGLNSDYIQGYFFGKLFGVYDHDILSKEFIEKKQLNKALSLDSRISGLLTSFYPLKNQLLTKNQKKEIKQREAVVIQENLFNNREVGAVDSTYKPNDLYIKLLKNKSQEEANEIIDKMMVHVNY